MSQNEGSVNNQFIHLQLSNNEVTMRGAPLCDLGHKLEGTRDGETEGIYAGWEWNGRRLRVFNDRFGFYPLYYFVRPGECAVSPSLPELFALSAPTDLDYDALAVFFHLGYFVGDDTPFQGIRAVPPSVSFEWQDGTVTMSSQLAVAKPQELDRHQAIDAYIELFRQAIVRRLTYSEEFAVLLSGGRDSRHILLELVRSGARPKFCLTVDLPVQHEDAVVAAQLAKAVDVPHTILPRRETSFGEEFEK
ncbi:MAG: asparagine synthase-related protein, partial [Nitrospira sp.]